MCLTCGCGNESNVTIDAPVRTNTKHVAPSYMNASKVGGQELHQSDASVIKGWNVPTPYGKGK